MAEEEIKYIIIERWRRLDGKIKCGGQEINIATAKTDVYLRSHIETYYRGIFQKYVHICNISKCSYQIFVETLFQRDLSPSDETFHSKKWVTCCGVISQRGSVEASKHHKLLLRHLVSFQKLMGKSLVLKTAPTYDIKYTEVSLLLISTLHSY